METSPGSGPSANSSSDFVRKLYKMLENPTDEQVVRWGNDGDSFVVLENEKFTKHILPKHFKHSNFASFVRQLNKYDFHKVRHANEDNGQSQYGAGAWEFKHPDFRANNEEALENIRRKAPAPKKPSQPVDEGLIQTQQMDLINAQLTATQQQLQLLQDRYNELNMHHSALLQELIGVQKTVVNHDHVMQNIMAFLHSVDAQRKRENRNMIAFGQSDGGPNGAGNPHVNAMEDDLPSSPLQHAAKLLSEANADVLLNPRLLEQISEVAFRMSGAFTTPSPEGSIRGGPISASRDPIVNSAGSSTSMRHAELDSLVYPVGQTNGIDPTYSEHIHNIPYSMPPKPPDQPDQRNVQGDGRKKSSAVDPGWVRQPQILLVEDDPTCRRIGGKFLYAFNCAIDNALDGLEAVNKMNAGSTYDLILMDIIMPNLDGVSACHLIRQFDTTPIIAMTSNIRSDDIAMYFHHGMNDVLPKPFTKEGLLQILNKHLGHLKKPEHGLEGMAPPQGQPMSAMMQNSSRVKDEDSPQKSPATTSNWSSPAQVPGVSPVTDEYMNVAHGHAGGYGMGGGMMSGLPYQNQVQMQMQMGSQRMPPQPQQQQQQQHQGQHRRQISDISGGEDINSNAKRQHMYGGQMQPQNANAMQGPR